jgi:hypothetical protein
MRAGAESTCPPGAKGQRVIAWLRQIISPGLTSAADLRDSRLAKDEIEGHLRVKKRGVKHWHTYVLGQDN